ncbi:MAG TPA: hypothetical protein VF665_18705 [Longimicrobium sp.]|jgi:hypothetical protein|uniref:hypothetical protein n=1 Tax=Longimicrobium sp. TaxID=2029185 RepID=UPI002ED9F3C9
MRARANALRGAGLLLALVAGAGGGQAHAQAPASALEAVPLQGLSFGELIPGVPETVRVSDAARRAEILLAGQGSWDVLMVLPDALTSAAGARIPLRFSGRDGAVMPSPSAPLLPFDPLSMGRVRISGGPSPARLLLGGTALPAGDQAAGSYTATVVVIINNPGT